jgi:pimeloyl-ACP methyl ester carboxylesterase
MPNLRKLSRLLKLQFRHVPSAPTAPLASIVGRSLFTVTFALLPFTWLSAQAAQVPGPLAFSFPTGGRLQVFTYDPSTVAFSPVTTAGAGAQESRSPDWSRLGWLAYQFGASGVRGIHVIRPDGTGDVRLTTSIGDERDPSWSPEGRFLVYSKKLSTAANYELWIHDTFGTPGDPGDDRDYALLQLPPASIFRPAWSPDGQSIAFVLTGGTYGANGRIATQGVRFNSGMVKTAGSFTILTDGTNICFDPTWSPDSQSLAFSSTQYGHKDIFQITATGQNSTRLTTANADNSNPSWSPDGSMIAFVSNRSTSGNTEIYAMAASGGEAASLIQITSNPGLNSDDPAWMPTPVSLLDPVNQLISGPGFTSDTLLLSSGGRPVVGVAADGVAKILIRVEAQSSSDQYTFTVLNDLATPVPSTNSDEDGYLTPLDLSSPGNAVTVPATGTPSGPMAFAVFTAPVDFARSAPPGVDDLKIARFVTLRIQQIGGGTPISVPIVILRPPVVLVHGVWSGPETWDSFTPIIADARFYSLRIDYGGARELLGVSGNSQQTLEQLRNLIGNFKQDKSVAAIQADVVTHSMGGLMARSWASRGNFVSSQDYHLGPVHKLITLDTPHLGSEYADALLAHPACVIALNLASVAPSRLRFPYLPVGQNIRDLSVTSPLILQQLRRSPAGGVHLRTHVIASAANVTQTAAAEVVLSAVGVFKIVGVSCADTVPNGFVNLFGGPNDLLVSIPSQLATGLEISGGNPPSSPSPFANVVHTVSPLYPIGPDVLNRGISGLTTFTVTPPVPPAMEVINLLNRWIKITDSTGFAPILP